MKHIRKSLVCLLLVLLLAVAALTGCGKNESNTEAPKTPEQTQANVPEATKDAGKTNAHKVVKLGEGDKQFNFEVTFSNGKTTYYSINTNEETVGKALLALELIAGDDSEYGLYVKTIGEETLDFDADGMYWAFYENGEYAMTGVDATPITQGATYSFVATKG